ncbi:MAG: NUDIX domain-containing protein [Deltaproteobacteria bacterium]|nr:NUDIX domain-containing protein [Deltaproteobacteria bacterium]
MLLPDLPAIDLDLVEDLSPPDQGGFLRLRRRRLRARYRDGRTSEPFSHDCVERVALDAVVVAAHCRDAEGRARVYLRSALRPAVRLRPLACRPLPERDTLGALWELPAGLVEPDECSPEGLRRCAARELGEELGFALGPEKLGVLGPAVFPTPGMVGERLHFFHVAVAPAQRGAPTEDGSVLERDAAVILCPLEAALAAARAGEIEDAKTEIGLRRLAEILAAGAGGS